MGMINSFFYLFLQEFMFLSHIIIYKRIKEICKKKRQKYFKFNKICEKNGAGTGNCWFNGGVVIGWMMIDLTKYLRKKQAVITICLYICIKCFLWTRVNEIRKKQI